MSWLIVAVVGLVLVVSLVSLAWWTSGRSAARSRGRQDPHVVVDDYNAMHQVQSHRVKPPFIDPSS